LAPSTQRIFHLLWQIWLAVGARNLGLISAGVAFFAFLAVFPAVAALIALLGFLADPAVIAPQLEVLSEFVPEDAYRLLSVQVIRLISVNESTLGWATALSTVAALWSARRGVSALVQGLNTIHGTENRGGVRHAMTALALTLTLMGAALVALATMVISPLVFAFVPLGPFEALMVTVAKWAAALAVVVVGISLVYRFGPNRRQRIRWLSPGLFLAVALWAAASFGFSQFLSNFGNYNEVYGSIGAVIALMMWFYISAWVVLFGAVLNAALEKPAGDAAAQ
jgi:membrane protein